MSTSSPGPHRLKLRCADGPPSDRTDRLWAQTPDCVLESAEISGDAKTVYGGIALAMVRERNRIYCLTPVADLASSVKMHRRKVQRCIRELVDAGYLARERVASQVGRPHALRPLVGLRGPREIPSKTGPEDATRVSHDATRVSHDATRVSHDATRVSPPLEPPIRKREKETGELEIAGRVGPTRVVPTPGPPARVGGEPAGRPAGPGPIPAPMQNYNPPDRTPADPPTAESVATLAAMLASPSPQLRRAARHGLSESASGPDPVIAAASRAALDAAPPEPIDPTPGACKGPGVVFGKRPGASKAGQSVPVSLDSTTGTPPESTREIEIEHKPH